MDPRVTALIEFIRTQLVKDPNVEIREDTPLVSSGLVDSFSLVELVLKVQEVTGKKVRAGTVSPVDFETVRSMLRVTD
jgi:acyl carrier protein